MLGRSRQDKLEDAFLLHMDKEEKSFEHLISTLESIKHEIHKTNSSMLEYNASHELKLVESHNDIMQKVFNRTVEQRVYIQDQKDAKEEKSILEAAIKEKVDKSQVKLVWYVLGVGAAGFAWMVNVVISLIN